MTALVCGGRTYRDRAKVREVLSSLKAKGYNKIVQGGQTGADTIAHNCAGEFKMTSTTVEALWQYFGKQAGPIRNAAMLHLYRPDVVVAFPGGRGTANMVSLAARAGVHVVDINAGEMP